MLKKIKAIRGMNDYFPNETIFWQNIEKIFKKILNNYGYKEIRLPIIEQTNLFQRAIGNITDVIEKQMYTFKNCKGKSLTLRPEGTASCIRASIENGIIYNQEQRFWYYGPMFRYEKPQRGRYRQFHQLGVEMFGQKGPDVDAELILITQRLWKSLGINKYVSLELNSIGSKKTRENYNKILVSFFKKNKSYLNKKYLKLINKNPIRILDKKDHNINNLIKNIKKITDYLDEKSKNHFNKLCEFLDHNKIKYKINNNLVRGLDYYNDTVFEWITNKLGSQNTICGGGRYDNLVEQLGGKPTPAIGFAIGIERLIMLIKITNPNFNKSLKPNVYLATIGKNIKIKAFLLAEKIRNEIPELQLITNYGKKNLKKQLIQAKKYESNIILIIEKKESKEELIIMKNLVTKKQEKLTINNIILKLKKIIKFNSYKFTGIND